MPPTYHRKITTVYHTETQNKQTFVLELLGGFQHFNTAKNMNVFKIKHVERNLQKILQFS